MKRNKYYLLTLILLMSVSSCKKFLETQPTDFLAPDTYYQTENHLNLALAGVYDILGHNELYKATIYYYKGFEVDEGFPARPTFININSNDFTATNGSIANTWAALYSGVNRANIVLAHADDNPAINADFRARIKAEALFLRAYYYFLLVQNWGGVPLLLTPTLSIIDTDVARAPAKDVYDQIIKDMIAAEAVIPTINAVGFGGRINKSAVRGILARVCLSMAGNPVKDVSKYTEARKWAKMVIDDAAAGHRLNPSYADVFIQLAQDKYDIKESIWEVEFTPLQDGFGETGTLGFNTGVPTPATNPTVGLSSGYLQVTSTFYDSFERGDLRKGWNIANYTYAAGVTTNTKTYREPTNQAQKYLYYVGKYRREYELSQTKITGVTAINGPLLRFSDVLLMFAEAENEISGPTAAAVDAINLVRRRAWAIGGIKSIEITNGGTTNYTTAPTVTFTGGGGTGGAVGTAVITAGKVTAVNLTLEAVKGYNFGSYTSAPTISFSGGGGAGAAATATLFTNADADVPQSAKADKAALRAFLQTERSRELCFEGTRKADLVRWGIYVTTANNVGNTIQIETGAATYYGQWYRNVQERHNLWPIPNSEIVLNKLLVQNPGWN